ncbi:MAG: helix-turn-helix domain-containing protein [Myxococcales bacterium]|nr:helix-turn-helix domain-containing protein [Myxococcales bacterium]
MSPREIKAAMVLAGVSLTRIARELGVSKGFVSQVVSGHRRTLRVQKAISASIGRFVEEVFPTEAGSVRPPAKQA